MVSFGFWAEYQFDLQWCERCSLGWVKALPDSQVFKDAYERFNVLSWRDKTPPELARDIRRAYLKGARVASQFLQYRPECASKPQDLAVLEVGSNIGAVLKGVTDRLGVSTSQALGIDFSENHAEVARQKFGFATIISTLEQAAPKLDKRFDLILAHHIIEHDENPNRFIDILKGLLKPGGIISFELPNGWREAKCMLEDSKAGIAPYTLINHINYFSPKGFGNLLQQHQLKTLHLCSLNANRVLHDFGWSKRNKSKQPASVPSLAAVKRVSVMPSFSDEGILSGIQRARREAPAIRFTHSRLRLHYPPSMPIGRDIEAYAQLPN
jgi:SAM-dependent methyltransferase